MKEGECVVTLVSFLLVYVEMYKPSFISESDLLVMLAGAHFERAGYGASFEIGASKEDFVNKASSNGFWKAQLRQSLSGPYSARKR